METMGVVTENKERRGVDLDEEEGLKWWKIVRPSHAHR
jgi:hypothetical protein